MVVDINNEEFVVLLNDFFETMQSLVSKVSTIRIRIP